MARVKSHKSIKLRLKPTNDPRAEEAIKSASGALLSAFWCNALLRPSWTEWQALLSWARRVRGPQFDFSTAMCVQIYASTFTLLT